MTRQERTATSVRIIAAYATTPDELADLLAGAKRCGRRVYRAAVAATAARLAALEEHTR